ncbi:hypothetical protein GGQ85_004335 [Nitrobacter vulgaris]|jgi:hypothetical protein|nr:hypothetical protein [Nitrobacter vulgaris]
MPWFSRRHAKRSLRYGWTNALRNIFSDKRVYAFLTYWRDRYGRLPSGSRKSTEVNCDCSITNTKVTPGIIVRRIGGHTPRHSVVRSQPATAD